MAQFMDLAIVDGPDEGLRFAVERGTYRVIGRFDQAPASTDQLTTLGDRTLNADQQELVNERVLAHGRASQLKHHRRGPDILLNDASVSRLHALILFDETGLTLADLMSTNGTRVNQQTVRFQDLKTGDVIHLGKTKLQVAIG